MKKITLLIFIISNLAFTQTTSIPDPSFEDALILQGIDVSDAMGFPDGYIDNFDAASVQILDISNYNITDLSGIEAFVNLEYLNISNNGFGSSFPLTNINLTNNLGLKTLICRNSFAQDIDVTGLQNLETVNCGFNSLSSIDISSSLNLMFLNLENNNFLALDLSLFGFLQQITLQNNALTSLNMRNLANNTITTFNASGNNNLTCIDVDNEVNATAGLGSYSSWLKDVTAIYSNNCSTLNVLAFEADAKSLLIFPTIVDDSFKIATDFKIGSIEVLNINSQKVRYLKSSNKYFVESLPSGIYFLKIKTENQIVIRKFLKK